MKIEDMGSSMIDDQLMIHVLKNQKSDYQFQTVLDKINGNKENLLEVLFKGLSIHSDYRNKRKENED
jgi:hypothetical protein